MSYRNFRDPMLPFGSDKCRCPTCGLYFNSTYAFDKHRDPEKMPGKHTGVLDRRCRSVDQLQALGWCQSKTGHWITEHRPPRD